METRDLMIGDWVWHDNQPYQIRQLGIFGENRDGEDYPAVCVGKQKGIGLIVERSEIEPIPLTPEILEKNGFELSIDFGNVYSLKEPQRFWAVYVSEGVYALSCQSIDSSFANIRYVHQLQHALRLCEIKKEIIL